MAEKWKGSWCSLPIDQPCALHGNIKKLCEECSPPLMWPDWNAIGANVLIHSVNSSHVSNVLVNHEGLCDVNRLLVSPWPSLRHPKWFNAIMAVRYHRNHIVVIPSRDHDFSYQILQVAICSASSSFPLTSPGIYQFFCPHRSSYLKVLFAYLWSGFAYLWSGFVPAKGYL